MMTVPHLVTPLGARLLTAREVAERLHVHRNTLRRIPRSRLPYVVVVSRGDRRYHPVDVANYLEGNG
jgi:predicted site-specific integrase-resolvase